MLLEFLDLLDIQTFDARRGGNVLYKAFTHPLAAEAIARLAAELRAAGPLAVFDPEGIAAALYALHPDMPVPVAYYVQDVDELAGALAGVDARPATEMRQCEAATLLIAGYETGRVEARVAAMCAPL